MTIGFIGLSHLGICTSSAVAEKGFDVLGFDSRVALVQDLSAGRLPVVETGLPELLRKNAGRIRFSSDRKSLATCELVYVSLDVPTDSENRSDVKAVENLILEYSADLAPGTVLVVLSQVPPGFTRPLHDKLKAGGIIVHYQVETLVFGISVERALYPERYMVGCADPKAPLPPCFEKLLKAFGCPILPMRFESAELAKISINFYLTSTVTVTNTLAEVCEKIGADWQEIAPAMRLDKRIGPHAYLAPGLGLAGGNLERDLVTIKTLSAQHGSESGVVDAWLKNSTYRKDWMLRTIWQELLSKKPDARLGILGLAYKVGTHSLKNAPSIAFLEALRPATGLSIKSYDPSAKLPAELRSESCTQVASCREAIEGADALIVFTPHSEFRALRPEDCATLMSGRTILDPFAAFDDTLWRDSAFRRLKMGC